MFLDVTRLLNYSVQWALILNNITKKNSKVLGYDIRKSVKFHTLVRRMEEDVSNFQSVVEVEQQNGGTLEILPLGRKY